MTSSQLSSDLATEPSAPVAVVPSSARFAPSEVDGIDGVLARPRPAVEWRAGWLRGPRHDVAMALLWVPFAVAAHAVSTDPDRLRTVVAFTLLFSFAHQPLTLWLVYGDAAQRRSLASSVVWAPVVLVLAVAVGTSVRPEVVALVAGVWNVAHTLRQRYGLSRLYGRLSGIESGADNRLLWSWLALAVIVAFARTDVGATARAVGIGRRNTMAFDAVASADTVIAALLPVAIAVAFVTTVRWAHGELRRSTHSSPRLVYLASTAALLVVLAVDPVVGFVGYVGAHAAEYLLVVRWRVDRAAQRPLAGDRVGALARRVGSGGTLALYAVAVVALILGIRLLDRSPVVASIVLTLGALHLFFDGFIWRSPRLAAASSEATGTIPPNRGGSR